MMMLMRAVVVVVVVDDEESLRRRGLVLLAIDGPLLALLAGGSREGHPAPPPDTDTDTDTDPPSSTAMVLVDVHSVLIDGRRRSWLTLSLFPRERRMGTMGVLVVQGRVAACKMSASRLPAACDV